MTSTATEGRRRAMSDPWADSPAPAAGPDAVRRSSPIDQAFDHVHDRQQRVDHSLDELGAIIAQLADRLSHALTAGEPSTYPEDGMGTDVTQPTPDDRRSTIAKVLTGVAERADHQADVVQRLSRRVGAIMDALEV